MAGGWVLWLPGLGLASVSHKRQRPVHMETSLQLLSGLLNKKNGTHSTSLRNSLMGPAAFQQIMLPETVLHQRHGAAACTLETSSTRCNSPRTTPVWDAGSDRALSAMIRDSDTPLGSFPRQSLCTTSEVHLVTGSWQLALTPLCPGHTVQRVPKTHAHTFHEELHHYTGNKPKE